MEEEINSETSKSVSKEKSATKEKISSCKTNFLGAKTKKEKPSSIVESDNSITSQISSDESSSSSEPDYYYYHQTYPSTTTSHETSLPSSDSTSSQSSSTSSPSSKESSDVSTVPSSDVSSEPQQSEAEKENLAQAILLSQNYNVVVAIPANENDFKPNFVEEYSKNPAEIKDALIQVKTVLQSFPQKFFSKALISPEFILVSKTVSQKITAEKSSIIIPCSSAVNTSELKKAVIEFSAKTLYENIRPSYSDYNPIDFNYGCVMQRYLYNASCPQAGYFISKDSQLNLYKDFDEMFSALLLNSSILKNMSDNSPLYGKLQYTSSLLYEYADYFGELPAIKYFIYGQ